jgi:hypothetical protein
MDLSNKITMPMRQFSEASGLGLTSCYGLDTKGEIETILVGKRRLVIVQSYLDYVERQRRAELARRAKGQRPANSPPIPTRDRRAGGSALAE